MLTNQTFEIDSITIITASIDHIDYYIDYSFEIDHCIIMQILSFEVITIMEGLCFNKILNCKIK